MPAVSEVALRRPVEMKVCNQCGRALPHFLLSSSSVVTERTLFERVAEWLHSVKFGPNVEVEFGLLHECVYCGLYTSAE